MVLVQETSIVKGTSFVKKFKGFYYVYSFYRSGRLDFEKQNLLIKTFNICFSLSLSLYKGDRLFLPFRIDDDPCFGFEPRDFRRALPTL